MARSIDFNCDLGEGAGADAAIVPLISSASIACGFHAGDPLRMRDTVALCLHHGVAIGAHPSYYDREGFGRRDRAATPAEVHALVLYQVGALDALLRAAGGRLHHVKPHGALYNRAAWDSTTAMAIASAVRAFDPALLLFGLAHSELTAAGEAVGLAVVHEAFAERRYDADGRLAPRGEPDAVIESLDDAIAQVLAMLRDDVVIARNAHRLQLHADSICLHGDRADAAAFARGLREAIEQAGHRVAAPMGAARA